jgi:hypothetical protein
LTIYNIEFTEIFICKKNNFHSAKLIFSLSLLISF